MQSDTIALISADGHPFALLRVVWSSAKRCHGVGLQLHIAVILSMSQTDKAYALFEPTMSKLIWQQRDACREFVRIVCVRVCMYTGVLHLWSQPEPEHAGDDQHRHQPPEHIVHYGIHSAALQCGQPPELHPPAQLPVLDLQQPQRLPQLPCAQQWLRARCAHACMHMSKLLLMVWAHEMYNL
jgi:hypothetical protein